MTDTVLDIKHWGINLGVRLPAAVARAAHLHADQRVRITVAVGVAAGHKAGQTSYVLCHQPKSFDWRLRGGAPHPMKKNVFFSSIRAVR
ncbi:MAG: PbsX family transcriptional regulator [Lamprobacter sp.]|uniref:AbrB/MazE/SpoVT family DNA-binding domain-containing protein n=1 Tax=Lamprobacter sp. TaxID=3100796 RepID=UPI002B261780|nr:PbsX family transcriptional regulator [Lamprobacter sp.]MEA3642980.1 PbsX family transcriptional regulator [Lamprobacter sp.]